jgi:hypothetical protein
MGFYKAEKPMTSKERVWPAIMIVAPTDPVEPYALAQDAPKSAAHPLVNQREGPFATMLEVLEPSPQGTIDPVDDYCKAVAIAAPGFGTNGVFELLQTFRSGPASAPPEVVTQEVETFSGNGDIHQASLHRVQGKSALCAQMTDQLKSPMGFRLTATQDHEIVRIANHLESRVRHSHIDRMQVQIGKQGADHGPLRAAFLRGPEGHPLHDILLEKCSYQLQHAPIRNITADVGQQRAVRNTVEVGFEVGIHHVCVTGLEQSLHLSQGVLASAPWSEPITVRDEYILEDRLDHDSHCSLDDSVPHTGDSQRSLLLAAELVNIDSTDRPRPVAPCAEFFGKSLYLSRKTFLEVFDTLPIRAGASSVPFDSHPSSSRVEGL